MKKLLAAIAVASLVVAAVPALAGGTTGGRGEWTKKVKPVTDFSPRGGLWHGRTSAGQPLTFHVSKAGSRFAISRVGTNNEDPAYVPAAEFTTIETCDGPLAGMPSEQHYQLPVIRLADGTVDGGNYWSYGGRKGIFGLDHVGGVTGNDNFVGIRGRFTSRKAAVGYVQSGRERTAPGGVHFVCNSGKETFKAHR